MSDAVIAESVAKGGSKRRQQVLLGVLLLAVLLYAVPKFALRDAGSSEVQSVPTAPPAAGTSAQEPEPGSTANDSGDGVDRPVGVREGKNPFEPRMRKGSPTANTSGSAIAPPAPPAPPAASAAPTSLTLPAATPPSGSTTSPSGPSLEDLFLSTAKDEDDARRALIRLWFHEYMGRGFRAGTFPDGTKFTAIDEQNLHVWIAATKGLDVALAGILDSDEAKAYASAG